MKCYQCKKIMSGATLVVSPTFRKFVWYCFSCDHVVVTRVHHKMKVELDFERQQRLDARGGDKDE